MIIISPYSRRLANGAKSPKDYPYWQKVINGLSDHRIIQIGTMGEEILNAHEHRFNLSFDELRDLLLNCQAWASVDNFFHHFAMLHRKPGIVIFGPSDPEIFGNKLNKNLLLDRKYLRGNQYDKWDGAQYISDWVDPNIVISEIKSTI